MSRGGEVEYCVINGFGAKRASKIIHLASLDGLLQSKTKFTLRLGTLASSSI